MRIRILLRLSLAFLLAATLGYSFVEPLYNSTIVSRTQTIPRVIAHKAIISGKHVGNSREAIIEANESNVVGIELDVRLSRDNLPFIYHSKDMSTLTTCAGAPEDLSWKELSNCKFTKSGSRIVSLEEAFGLIKPSKFLFLDIKEAGIINKRFAQILVEFITSKRRQERVIVESFNPIFLTFLRSASHDVMIMYDFTADSKASEEEEQAQFNRIPWLLKQPYIQKQIRRFTKPDVLGPRWNFPIQNISELHKQGYPLVAWTVDELNKAKELFTAGVLGVQSNVPLALLQ
jgi:glycerophosphoryl diester phosphodiesterase